MVAAKDVTLADIGLDWKVKKESVKLVSTNRVIPGQKCIVREDTKEFFGMVTNRFQPIQNEQLFEFAQKICDRHPTATIETTGMAKSGQWRNGRVYIGINLGEDDIGGGDKVRRNVALINGHRGDISGRIISTPQRIFCTNQLAGLMRTSKDTIKIHHTGDIKFKLKLAMEALNMADQDFVNLKESWQKLMMAKTNEGMVRNIIRVSFEKSLNQDDHKTRFKNIEDKIVGLFKSGRNHSNHGKTLWDAYNGITEYLTHHRSARSTNDAYAVRMEQMAIGDSLKVANRAMDYCLEAAA